MQCYCRYDFQILNSSPLAFFFSASQRWYVFLHKTDHSHFKCWLQINFLILQKYQWSKASCYSTTVLYFFKLQTPLSIYNQIPAVSLAVMYNAGCHLLKNEYTDQLVKEQAGEGIQKRRIVTSNGVNSSQFHKNSTSRKRNVVICLTQSQL